MKWWNETIRRWMASMHTTSQDRGAQYKKLRVVTTTDMNELQQIVLQMSVSRWRLD